MAFARLAGRRFVLVGSFVLLVAWLAASPLSAAAIKRRSVAASRAAIVRATKNRVVGRAGTPTVHLRGFRDFNLGPKPLGTGNRSHGNAAVLSRTRRTSALSATRRTGPASGVSGLGKLREVPSLRTLDSDTFQSASGAYLARVYTDAVNFRGASGKLEPINDRLHRSGSVLIDRADADHLRLPVRLNRAISISEAGRKIRLRLLGASGSARAVVKGTAASYSNAYPGTRVSLQAIPGSLEFSFSLASPSATRVFRLSLTVPHGLHARLRDRALWLLNKHGHVEFQIPVPMMLDQGHTGVAPTSASSSQVRVSAKRHGGKLTLTYRVGRSWLRRQTGRFPVILDPQITPTASAGSDCTIYSNAQSTNDSYCGGATYDVVGAGVGSATDAGGAYVTMMNFPDDPGSIPADSEILGASLSMDVASLNGNVSYSVLPMSDTFTAGDATWQYANVATDQKWACAGGDYDGCQSGSPTTIAGTDEFTQTGAGKSTVSITALMQAWIDGSDTPAEVGGQQVLPLMLYPTSTGGTASICRFSSTTSSGAPCNGTQSVNGTTLTDAPYLSIYYTPRLGGDPGSTIPATSLDADTSLGLNVANGDVQVQQSDLSVAGTGGMNLDLSDSYNGNASGGSWTLDQPPALITEPGVDDAEVLTEPDGNQSVWSAVKSTVWGEGGTYTPPAGTNGTLCQALPDGSPATAIDGTNQPYVFYIGTDGQIHGSFYDTSTTNWESMNVSAGTGAVTPVSTAAPDSSLAVDIEPGSDRIHVFYVDQNHAIAQWYYDETKWGDQQIGGIVGQNTSPAAALYGTNDQFVYYNDGSGNIWQMNYAGSGWTNTKLAPASGTANEAAAPNSSPGVYIEPSTGYKHVYYVDDYTGTNVINQWYDGSSGWGDAILGGTVAPNTSPAVAETSSYASVFYTDSATDANGNDDIGYLLYPYGGVWYNHEFSSSPADASAEPDTSPSIALDSNKSPHVYYTGADGRFSQLFDATVSSTPWDPTDSWGVEDPLSQPVAPNTNPAAPTYTAGTQTPFYIGADGQIHEPVYNGVWTDQAVAGPVGVGSCKPKDPVATWELTYYNSGEKLDFNAVGKLIAAYDRNGNAITYTYTNATATGLVSKIIDTQQRGYSFSYTGNELTTVTDQADGRAIHLGWTSSQLTSDTDAASRETQYGYTGGLTVTDPNGNATTVTYPTPPAGAWLQVNVATPANSSGGGTETTKYVYYLQGTAPPAGVPTCGGSGGSEIAYGYTVVTRPDGNWTEDCYDTHDRVYETFDEVTDQPTVTDYDVNDDVTQVNAPANTQFGSPTVTSSATFDACFRQTSQTTGTGTAAPTSTETYARPATTSCPATSPNDYLPTAATQPAGTPGVTNKTQYTYDGNGNLKSLTDGLSNQNTLSFDYYADGMLKDSYDADGQATAYVDTWGQSANTCGPSGTAACSGVLASSTVTPPAPLAASTSSYDINGRATSGTDGDGNKTQDQYNPDDQVTTETYINSSGTTTGSTVNTYDGGAHGDGNVTSSVYTPTSGSAQTTSYLYWPDNQLETETDPGAPGQTSTSTNYAYDGNGSLTCLTDGGGSVTYGYDNDDRAISVNQPNNTSESCSDVAAQTGSSANQFTFLYDNDGRLVCTTDPNGMVTQQLFDAYNNLTGIQAANGSANCNQASTTGTPNGTVFDHYAYTYANGSNLAQSETITAPSTNASWNYYYDPLNRLIEASNGQADTYNYSYDGDGNLTSRTTDPSTGAVQTATYNNANEISSLTVAGTTYTPTYDTAGNLETLGSAAGTTTLQYNDEEQTSSINPNGAGAQALSYRSNGQSHPLQTGNQPSGGGAPGLEEDSLGISASVPSASSGSTSASTDTYYTRAPSGTLLAERTPSIDYYYVQDANGSVVALTSASPGAPVVNTYSYDPFGATTASTGTAPNSFGFDSGYDAQGGLILFGARYYDPGLGIWTQPDPNAQSLTADPTQADAYGFAGDDPVNAVDLDGEGKISRKVKQALAIATALHALGGAIEIAGQVAHSPAAEKVGRVVEDVGEAVEEVADTEKEGEEHPGEVSGGPEVTLEPGNVAWSDAKFAAGALASFGAAAGGWLASESPSAAGDIESVLQALA